MTETGYKRLSAEIPPDMHHDLYRRLPQGVVSESIRRLIAAMFDAMDRDGDLVVYHVLRGEVKLIVMDEQERSNLER